MSQPSFNLVDQPWMPCVTHEGGVVELSLRHVLANAHTLRDLSGDTPMVTVALYRLLLAILHRSFGPGDTDTWYEIWNAGRFDMARLDAYLAQWQTRFDLFDPDRPFFQARDARVKPKAVNSMIHEVASGNNATLFDHNLDDQPVPLTPAQAARLLLAVQSFGLAGLSGLPDKFTYAPCVGGINFLIVGESLFESLLLNLVPYTRQYPIPSLRDDAPAWEREDAYVPERGKPLGYLDYLTWHNRRVLLLPDTSGPEVLVREMTMTPGLRLEGLVLNPMMHYYTRDKKQGLLPLRFSESRALWRDSAALFQLRSEGQQPPRAMAWIADLVGEGYLDKDRQFRIAALGMLNDQAKVEFYRTEQLQLPPAYLEEQHSIHDLVMVLDMAENTARQLWGAARKLATTIVTPNSDAPDARKPLREDLDQVMGPWGVERVFWSQLEAPFRVVFELLPAKREEAIESWISTVRRAAWSAMDTVAAGLAPTPRNLKGIIQARGQLAAGLSKLFPNH